MTPISSSGSEHIYNPEPAPPEPDEVIWLIGDGRSGTTWAADLINCRHAHRLMFEPFHPRHVPGMQRLGFHRYLRPDEPAAEIRKLAAEVFSGRLRHHRVDAGTEPPEARKLLIKDIFANLFAHWAARRFPRVKIVLLIRNPFAVAWSKHRARVWLRPRRPEELLAQPKLRADYLRPFEATIRDADDFIERQVTIWAIIHYVPLLQFRPGQILTVFYEDLVEDPHRELSRVFAFSSPETPVRPFELSAELLNRPSRVTDPNRAFVAGRSPIDAWQQRLSARQIERGRSILRRFELEELYGTDGSPDRRITDKLLARPSVGPGPILPPIAIARGDRSAP